SSLHNPEEMPEKEARPPAQNRHGGAPRGERVPLDARRASPGTARRAPKRATTEDLRLSAPRSPPVGGDGTEPSKTRAQQRAAGTKKTALFDMVNRNIAATRPGPPPSARTAASPDDPLVSCPSACLGADFCARCRYARASRDPGETRRAQAGRHRRRQRRFRRAILIGERRVIGRRGRSP